VPPTLASKSSPMALISVHKRSCCGARFRWSYRSRARLVGT
jgi:hypothetical protein